VWETVKRLVVAARCAATASVSSCCKTHRVTRLASDPLSSVAYATQEILLVLTLGDLAYLYLAPWVGLAVVALLAVVVISYRQVWFLQDPHHRAGTPLCPFDVAA